MMKYEGQKDEVEGQKEEKVVYENSSFPSLLIISLILIIYPILSILSILSIFLQSDREPRTHTTTSLTFSTPFVN